jgi:hypothetical protein
MVPRKAKPRRAGTSTLNQVVGEGENGNLLSDFAQKHARAIGRIRALQLRAAAKHTGHGSLSH